MRTSNTVLGAVGLAVAGAVGLALAGAAGFGRGSNVDTPNGVTASTGTSTTIATSTTTNADPIEVPEGAALGPVVRLRAADPDAEEFPIAYEAVGGLEPNTVLRVEVAGFDAFAAAEARQCAAGSCANTIAVQFGEGGTASFQYLVFDDFSGAARASRCSARSPCSIVVEDLDRDTRAEVTTVFHEELISSARIHVTPRTGLRDGQTVTVMVENYPPGARVEAMLCAAPAATGPERCGRPGPTAPLTVGPDGTGTTDLTIRLGPVGQERVECGRNRRCGISVASGEVFVGAPVVQIGFATPPGAEYDASRLVAALAGALVLLSLATVLVRRTDWSPLGEEAAPEIDEAEYADLDALAAASPPQPDLEEMLAVTRRQ